MATGYDEAALALSEHHFDRRLRRCRTEVVSVDIGDLSDAELLCSQADHFIKNPWNKSIIVEELVAKYDISRQTARTIASMVEEKVLNMGITLVSASLVKQLVLSDAAAVLRAEHQLQTI